VERARESLDSALLRQSRSVTREGEGLACDCLALEVEGYVERARESLDTALLRQSRSVCNPRGRGACLRLPSLKSICVERGGCVRMLGIAPPVHTLARFCLCRWDHHTSSVSTLGYYVHHGSSFPALVCTCEGAIMLVETACRVALRGLNSRISVMLSVRQK